MAAADMHQQCTAAYAYVFTAGLGTVQGGACAAAQHWTYSQPSECRLQLAAANSLCPQLVQEPLFAMPHLLAAYTKLPMQTCIASAHANFLQPTTNVTQCALQAVFL